ncbi:Nitrosoguanidine resistance [Hyphodiscus hymeniophilus]|uniref:Nitrosoguanidine resistance n=1 Tax=Hyphodiscus hymeniophilus TaxID=353542 RepID=A0A9P6VEE4_9HELO|nr:Nitrosoguanidine resistance [Hyphodiscus hymeniophilus]
MVSGSEATLEQEDATAGPANEKSLMDRALPGIRSPHLAQERKLWRKMFIIFIVLLVTIVLGILSIYWGADHSLQFNVPVFTVAIVDFDQGEVGPALQQAAAAARAANPKMTLGYVSEPGSAYNFSNEQVIHALKQEHFWVALVVQADATTAMNFAYNEGNTSYDPTDAIHLIYEEGRNALAIDEYAYPLAVSFLNSFVMEFAKTKQQSLATTNAGDATALARQAANPIPISFTVINTAPYVPSTAEAATEIGTICKAVLPILPQPNLTQSPDLIIISFLSVLMFSALNESMMGKVSLSQYYAFRMLVLPTVYFFLSLLYLLLSVVWQIRFDKFYGASGYVIYWMLSWIGMMAFGLAVENVNNLLGPPFTPVFFVFWVISNVSTGFYPIELLSNFYLWGLAWPLRHVLIGAKALLFGTKDLLGLNFGVLITWVAISLALQPFTIWVQLKRQKGNVEAHRREVLERVHGKETQ